MQPIFPLEEEHIVKHCGRPVCVVMRDGSRYVGVLSACRDGKVILNSTPEAQTYGAASSGKRPASGKAKKRKSASGPATARTLAFPFAGPGFGFAPFGFGGELALDLALIALIFLLL